MTIEIRGNQVYGLEMWWTPESIWLTWEAGGEEKSVTLTEETVGIPADNSVTGAELHGGSDAPFAEDWIRRVYGECHFEPGKEYRQEVSVSVEKAIELGILIPAEEDPELGKDGPTKSSRDIPLLTALWAINRRAKRCRDLAKANYEAGEHALATHYRRWKEEYYRVKGYALHYLMAEGRMVIAGHHRFDGELWAEVLNGEGYTFHRPCLVPEVDADPSVVECGRIEARPKDATEPPVDEALAIMLAYLEGKPEVEVYSWPHLRRSASWLGEDEYFGDSEPTDDFGHLDEEDW